MNIGRIFAHAIARRIALVLVAAVLAWCGIGRAQAATTCSGLTYWQDAINASYPSAGYTFPSREAAQAACNSIPSKTAYPDIAGWFYDIAKESCKLNEASKNFTLKGNRTGTNVNPACNGSGYAWTPASVTATGWYFDGPICPAGETWNAATQSCFNRERCLAKPALGPTFTGGSMQPVTCVDGCQFSAGAAGACVSTGSGSACSLTGAEPTGLACAVGDAPPQPEKPQQCTPNGEVCIKPDGQHCMAASNGRQVCWRPGETGEKDDGPVKQKRDAGTQPIAPNLQLPSGDNLQPTGPAIQSTTTTNNTTITTVTQNYQTQHGTNAGDSNQGESGTGDGTGKEGDGEGDGTATGGQNCETSPVTTGDPVLGMVATQAWATRCAVEAGNAAKVTGDVGNCAQPFAVEGNNANAHQLRALRAQICKGDANGDGQPDWTKPDGTEAGEGGDDEEPGILARMVNTDMLDTSGFLGGGSQCPQLGSLEFGPFGEFNLDSQPYFCDLIALMRGVVLLMGLFLSLRILTGDVL